MDRLYLLLAALALFPTGTYAQKQPALSPAERSISTQLDGLRKLPDDEWTRSVARLAAQIAQLPAGQAKTMLIGRLGNLVTEGDAGHDTLQSVASTMADVLRDFAGSPISATLAQLVRYEHVQVECDNPNYRAAMAKLEAEDERRRNPRFTLRDLHGTAWSFEDLRGKVVLVNFWATWCPPCRREMPDMQALYERFRPRGLVVLAISDEDAAKVAPFIAAANYTYPVLLDPGRKVHELFGVQGIPKSFVYGRGGRLAASAIDRRTERQFLALLKEAGIE